LIDIVSELKKRMGVGGHALVSECPEHWTIQPQT